MKTILSILLLALAVKAQAAFPVFIGGTGDYWTNSGNYLQLWSTDARTGTPSMMLSLNRSNLTFGIGLNTANSGGSVRGFDWLGQVPVDVATASGTTATTLGGLRLRSGAGGSTTIATTGTGGNGGSVAITSGGAGLAESATTASTGGSSGSFTFSVPGGGSPSVNATTTTGGSGGAFTFSSGNGGTPSAGTTRIGGNAGAFTMFSGDGGGAVGGQGGNGGSFTFLAGNAGGSSGAGNPGNAGSFSMVAGNGANGNTNSNGGSVFVVGGTGGTSAQNGNVVLARTSGGTARGGVQIGPTTSATVTNWLTGTATLDFGNIAAAGTEDLPITVAGATTNDVAQIGVPWQAAITGGTFTPFTSNGVVYVRFANHTGGAVNPASASFRAFVTKSQ